MTNSLATAQGSSPRVANQTDVQSGSGLPTLHRGKCLLWTGTVDKDGYGRRQIGGRGGRKLYVHRLAYAEAYGPIPEGMQVRHHCGTPSCYQAAHLFLDARRSVPVADRFERFVLRTPACWLWTGSLDHGGYGSIKQTGTCVLRAHRVSYEKYIGPIPEGLQLDHLCRNRACVNPAHLEPVTKAENMRRGFGFSAINARKTHCLRGHELSGENLAIWSGRRNCRTCVAARAQRVGGAR